IKIAMNVMTRAWVGWKAFSKICPTCAHKIEMWGLKELLLNAPKGVELEDIAYFVGRVIGSQGVVGKIEKGIEVTVWVFTKIVLEYAVLVTALHAPKILATGLEEGMKEKAVELKKKLDAGGYTAALAEAAAMIREFYAHPEAEAEMSELRTLFDKLGKSLVG